MVKADGSHAERARRTLDGQRKNGSEVSRRRKKAEPNEKRQRTAKRKKRRMPVGEWPTVEEGKKKTVLARFFHFGDALSHLVVWTRLRE